MLGESREMCRQLLRDDVVQVVIGYGQTEPGASVHPVFVTGPEQADRLTWNQACHANLVTYMNRPDVRAMGKAAVLVKACDERALVVLEQECQLERSDVYVIGLACGGVDEPRTAKCRSCRNRTPRFADMVIGVAAEPAEDAAHQIAPLDLTTFDFIRPVNSIKEFLFSRHETLFSFSGSGRNVKLTLRCRAAGGTDRHRGPTVRRSRAADSGPRLQLGLQGRTVQSPSRTDDGRHTGLPRS